MSSSDALQPITTATATYQQAFDLYYKIVRVTHPVPREMAIAIYEALRSWTWKTISQRRRADQSLAHWYDFLREAAAFIEENNPQWSAKIKTLAELLLETQRFGEVNATAEVWSRAHVQAVLEAVEAKKQATLSEIQNVTQLTSDALERVVPMMVAASLLDQIAWEPKAVYAPVGARLALAKSGR